MSVFLHWYSCPGPFEQCRILLRIFYRMLRGSLKRNKGDGEGVHSYLEPIEWNKSVAKGILPRLLPSRCARYSVNLQKMAATFVLSEIWWHVLRSFRNVLGQFWLPWLLRPFLCISKSGQFWLLWLLRTFLCISRSGTRNGNHLQVGGAIPPSENGCHC